MKQDVETEIPARIDLLPRPRSGAVAKAPGRRGELAEIERKPGRIRRVRILSATSGIGGLLSSFILMVLVPTIAAGLYYGLMASDVYVSEAKFAVRGSGEKLPSSSSAALSMFSSLSSMNSNQEAYVLANYIQSRPLIEKMEKQVGVRDIFTRPDIDPLSRLSADAPAERLRRYWDKMVVASIDNLSGVLNLEVRAFRPQDALAIAQAILVESETLVNDISRRKRTDTVAFAREEVARAEKRLKDARVAIEKFRNASGTLDPVKSAEATSRVLIALRTQKMDFENEIATARRTLSESSPSVQVLSSRLKATSDQIATIESQLTSKGEGGGDNPASRKLARYEGLELEREFAEKVYILTLAALERSRIEADRQQIYLVTFVPPGLAERSLFPNRPAATAVVFACAIAIWSVLSLLVAAVKDHNA